MRVGEQVVGQDGEGVAGRFGAGAEDGLGFVEKARDGFVGRGEEGRGVDGVEDGWGGLCGWDAFCFDDGLGLF